MEAYTGSISTRKVDSLVEALVGVSGISKSEVSRICAGLDEQVKASLGRPLDHARFPYVYLDLTYLLGRLGRNPRVCSHAMVDAIAINVLDYREVLGIAVGDCEAEGFWGSFWGASKRLKNRLSTGSPDPEPEKGHNFSFLNTPHSSSRRIAGISGFHARHSGGRGVCQRTLKVHWSGVIH